MMLQKPFSRRDALRMSVTGLGMTGAALAGVKSAWAAGSPEDNLVPAGAATLRELATALAKAPRRRNFKTVPMILTGADQWDAEALELVLRYHGGPKQVWDNTSIDSPWLNLMRNSMNVQIWSFKHANFLAVSATHGSAHLALYDDFIWSKYLTKLTRSKWTRNVWLKEPPASRASPADFDSPHGVFSPYDNSITVLQRRGLVFLACHNEVWELTLALRKKGINPDNLGHEQMAAEFTNHLIPGAVLTPGIVGTLPELQRAGFGYAK
jgi:hypothetical protein